MKILAIRGEPGLSRTQRLGERMGLRIEGAPMFEAEPVDWSAVEPALGAQGFDGLMITSANAIRHGGAALARLRHLPVFAVGETSAEAARAAGFKLAHIGRRGARELVAELDAQARDAQASTARRLRLLRLAGEDHIALDPKPAISIETRVVYRIAAREMPASLVEALREPALVLLHSASAARHFAERFDAHRLDRAAIALAGLSARVIEAAGEGWRAARWAERPDDRELLALARAMCH